MFIEFLFLPFQLFLLFPYLSFVLAGTFYVLFKRKKKGVLLIPALSWLIYGVWECYMWFWMKTVIAPIRIDLLLIIPYLYVISTIGVVVFIAEKK
ncbi:MAG: hypothetical protein H6755_02590 [Candidatus Omnitrophica bacterium]|nr:hypothetical protein [Candidatus Omnitrophota bacterium]MCB9747275.1 hypothetical protein [Candidatus Omnitrophota bacterium]